MSIDFKELFNEEGRHAPPSTLDTDYIVRRGRRVRARRRASVGASALLGVGVVALASVALASTVPSVGGTSAAGPASSASSSPAAKPTGGPTPWGAPPADLAAVSLPDPAPDFPVRRFPDSVQPESSGPGNQSRWVSVFGLAASPERTSTPSPGVVVSHATGPKVTIFVGAYSKPVHLSGLKSRSLAGSPEVAGVVGHLAEYTEKGTTFRCLYFTTGKFTVEIIGADVTTAQFVALGNALTGLQ
jgi:hypothetical protein